MSDLHPGAPVGAFAPSPEGTEPRGRPVHRFASTAAFLDHRDFEPSIVRIVEDDMLLEFSLEPGRSGTPLVVDYDATGYGPDRAPSASTLPDVTTGIEATRIHLSDPSLTLGPGLGAGWFAGHRGLRLQEVWPRVLDHLVLCCESSREIHFGVSAGGFAALYYAHDRPHAVAVPVNPQTSLKRHSTAPVANYLRAAWGLPEDVDIDTGLTRIPAVHDLNELYGRGHSNTVVYIQNLQDDHVFNHLAPFLEATHGSSRPESVAVHLHRWGEGHVPPTPDFLTIVLRTLSRPTWQQSLRDGKYLRLPDPETVREAGARTAASSETRPSAGVSSGAPTDVAPRPYVLSDFVQDLRYGRRDANDANPDFVRMAGELESQFARILFPLAPETRRRYAEYIDLLRYTRGLDAAVQVAHRHLEQGLDAPLVAVSIQQTCKRAGDFDRAGRELARLNRANPDSPYIALLHGQSLQATASWEALQELARSVLGMPSLPSQPTMSDRWAKLLLESAYPRLAHRFIETLPELSVEKNSLRHRASLFAAPPATVPEIPTLVINLEEDHRKRSVATGALERAGHSCQVLGAVDARDLPGYALQNACSDPEVVREIGAGAVGCALSHIKAWEHIAAHCSEGAFVVEDDAAPYTGIARVRDIMSSVGELDMLFVNERLSSVYGVAAPSVPRTSTLDPWTQIGGWRPDRTGWGFDGYFISAHGAEKLLRIMDRERIQEHIDGQVGSYGLRGDLTPSTVQQRMLLEFRLRIDDAEQLRTLALAYPATTQNNFGFSTIGTITRDSPPPGPAGHRARLRP